MPNSWCVPLYPLERGHVQAYKMPRVSRVSKRKICFFARYRDAWLTEKSSRRRGSNWKTTAMSTLIISSSLEVEPCVAMATPCSRGI